MSVRKLLGGGIPEKIVDRLLDKELAFILLVLFSIWILWDSANDRKIMIEKYDRRISKLEQQMIETQRVAQQCQADMLNYIAEEGRLHNETLNRAVEIMERLDEKLK